VLGNARQNWPEQNVNCADMTTESDISAVMALTRVVS